MIEEDYETYKEMYFVVFPASNLEGMAKELHAALIAYQARIRELEAFQQSVQSDECPEGDLHKWFPPVSNYSQYCSKCGIRR